MLCQENSPEPPLGINKASLKSTTYLDQHYPIDSASDKRAFLLYIIGFYT